MNNDNGMSTIPVNYRSFAYGSLRVGVSAADPSLFTWLDEFLAPSFCVGWSTEVDWNIRVVSDLPRYERALNQGPAVAGRMIDCFTHDGYFKQHPLWRRTDEQLTVWIDSHRCFATFKLKHCEIEVLCGHPKSRPRLLAMRLIRELATIDQLQRGHLHVHASAYVNDCEDAVVMAGPKRSGKTSSLIHAMLSNGARYLTNDRLYLHFENGQWMVRGMPTIVSLRPQTFRLFPGIGHQIRRLGFRKEQTLAESRDTDGKQCVKLDNKVLLTPAQFCYLLDSTAVGPTRLECLVFPSITSSSFSSGSSRLSTDEAAHYIRQSIFSAGWNAFIPTAFSAGRRDQPADNEHLHQQCYQLASDIDCFSCALGPDAYTASAWLRSLEHAA